MEGLSCFRNFSVVILCSILISCGGGDNESDSESASITNPSATSSDSIATETPSTNTETPSTTTETPDTSTNIEEPDTGTPAPGNPALVSQTSGVAPLGLFFNANPSSTQDFHEREYQWDFGDSESGTWATNGRSKNSDKGAIAAHVYETPGTYIVQLTVRDGTGVIGTDSVTVTVEDPNVIYSGEDTICVSTLAASNFNGCPSGAIQLTTDIITDIEAYISDNKRVLFHRGSAWTTSGRVQVRDIDDVLVGAYGVGLNQDARGLYNNAPQIQLETNGAPFFDLGQAEGWRITGLSFSGDSDRYAAIGATNFVGRLLVYKNRISGLSSSLRFSHWQIDGHDQIMLVDNDLSDPSGMAIYTGSERLVLLGNSAYNSQTTHVVRIWQAHLGLISHNLIYGSSLNSSRAGHALKLHGPKEEQLEPAFGGGGLANRSENIVLSNNIFGGSGPWPVEIGPQNSVSDERVKNIVIERNKFITDLGGKYPGRVLEAPLIVHAQDLTIRNNLFDDTGSDGRNFKAISVYRRGIEPEPNNVSIFNNTIYMDPAASYGFVKAIRIGAGVTNSVIKNNLVSGPLSASALDLLSDESDNADAEANELLSGSVFTAPSNPEPTQRNFQLQEGSGAIDDGVDAGVKVPVWDDFNGTARPANGDYDIGAFER